MENLQWQIIKVDTGFKIQVTISIEVIKKIIDGSIGMNDNEELILSSKLTEDKILDFHTELSDFVEKYEMHY